MFGSVVAFLSSPRQKMVVVAPSQPVELKKRQTLERAKANHLSKQLQMRLQYAKLKVEHGWQRQNLNEVENLYFHHSHQRNMRQGPGPRTHYAYPLGTPMPAETHVVQSPAPSAVPDRAVGPSPSVNEPGPSPSFPCSSPPEHGQNADTQPSSQPQSHLSSHTATPVAPVSTATNRPPSALDLSDPNVLARLAQLQAQVQPPSQPQSQSQAQTVSRTTASQQSQAPPPVPIPLPGTFAPYVQFPQSGYSLLGQPMPNSVPLYPIPTSVLHNLNPAGPSQPLPPTSAQAAVSVAPIPAMSMPTPTPIASSALTYDSFWSTHASSTGSTRLYRTHTGFTASATPGGNVAMLTPGGHAAVMTAEGVYVGGSNK